MKKSLILIIVTVVSLLISGCGKKEIEDKPKITISSGEISTGIVIGKELAHYKIKDQFDKEHNLNLDVKKVIFAFSNVTGQLMKVYMSSRKTDYLTSRNIVYIADISGMPSIISKMFAIPDMKESVYPILLIREKENAKRFRNEEQKNAIMIISLENKIVQNVKFVTNETDLKAELD